jgi:hypothetical protein
MLVQQEFPYQASTRDPPSREEESLSTVVSNLNSSPNLFKVTRKKKKKKIMMMECISS